MATKKLSDLPVAGTIVGTETVFGIQSGFSVQIPYGSFKDITATGRVTTPNQPFFAARPTTDYSAGSMPTGVVAMTAQINNGNCFSAATSRFTAPIAGFYKTTWGGLQLTSTVTSLMINGVRDNYPSGVHYLGASYSTVIQSVIRLLAANDYLQIEGWNGGGYYNTWYAWSVELIG